MPHKRPFARIGREAISKWSSGPLQQAACDSRSGPRSDRERCGMPLLQ